MDGNSVVERNNTGQITAGLNRKTRRPDTESVELLAVAEGIKLNKEINWEDIIVETDAHDVINQLKGTTYNWRITTMISNIFHQAASTRKVMWEAIPLSIKECANWITTKSRLGVRLDD